MPGRYPVFLDVSGRPALVVGGGPVAARKAAMLASCEAEVTVVAAGTSPEMEELARTGKVNLDIREFTPEDIHGKLAIVVAATGDPGLNEEVARIAAGHGVLSNSADPPDAGDVILPSVINEGPLTVAVSTGGISPALSKKLRKDLSAVLSKGYGPFLEFMASARERLKAGVASQEDRAAALNSLVESDLPDRFREDPGSAAREADEALDTLLRKYAG